MSWFISIEESPLSVWVREEPSLWGFPFILYLHTLGLAMLAGLSVGLDFWLLMLATRVPRVSIAGLYRVMWIGFGVNAVSGVLLLSAYPAKALTNLVFYAKMLMIALALAALESLRKEVFVGAQAGAPLALSKRARLLAIASLLLWTGTIFTGRLLAYTHHILLASDSAAL
ncbi:MAG TPA: hypothetical protein VFJ95_09140 [Gammaproteobacteria bacterium]|nr:hypothetical protein [Gammaproteobacteria bacterium]